MNMLNYPSYHKYYTKNEEFEESPNYFDFLDNMSIGNAHLMVLPEYEGFVDAYIGRETYYLYENDEELKDIPHAYYYAKMRIIDELIADSELKVKMMKDVAMDVANYEGVDGTDSLFNIFYSKCQDTAYINEVQKAVKAWENLAKGMPAPGFTYKDIDGNMVSLSDFKGKYVYIDVWATWCGPCKAETPFFKELVKEYEGKNIVFMGVSVDSNVEAWEKMVKEKEMNWVQLVSEDAWNTKITKDYMIKGIPRFILIDADGNIVSANAPRPSGKIREMLDSEGI
ncbi:TlpA family protein disulfide reductase [Bacteroidota bacterium]